MIVTILGFVVVIVSTYFVYKTARDNRRNSLVWAAATLAAGFGLQIVAPVILAILIVFVMFATGTPQSKLQGAIQTPAIIVTFACLLLSFGAMGLIMRYVAKIPDDGPVESKQQRLSIFNENE